MTDLLRSDAHEWARDEAIRAFLKGRPDFVLGDAELMDAIGVRPHAANVIEFGPEALSRVARAHREEAGVRRQLERVAEANFEAQSRTHEAVIEVIAARSHTDLARRLDELARGHFGLSSAVMALEGPERVPAGWRPLVEGQAHMIVGRGKAVRLGVVPTALGLFGAAEDVGSVALVRLSLWAPARTGVLAFGAKSEETFAADMGHELLDFLARVVERTAERWPLP